MPEDWMASTTTAFNGTLEIEGEGLGRLEDGRLVKDVVGTLPILVKLLDSDERLVIQAHPTVPCAKRLFNSPVGKTECWYFLPGTAPDACVYLGFKPGITREKWEAAFKAQDGLLDMLHRIPVAAGDFVFVDGGMPHAIGGGCFMIELQEPSDLMVVAERVTPSGRRIPDAKMHGGVGWEKMFEVYEYEGLTYEEVCARYVKRAAGGSQLAATAAGAINCAPPATDAQERVPPVMQILGPELTDKFEMWRVTNGGRVALQRDRSVAVVTDGTGEVNGLAVKKGDRLVIANERQLAVSGEVTLVVCA
jgi:mannose-6-phosphate isomerase class I